MGQVAAIPPLGQLVAVDWLPSLTLITRTVYANLVVFWNLPISCILAALLKNGLIAAILMAMMK